MKTALTIAGSDSSGGAGIQQDLRVFSSLGVYGASAITAITAQNTIGIQKIEILPLRIISAQIDSVMKDLKPTAVKTGMLATKKIVSLVYKKMREYSVKNLVVDPVMFSTSGKRLLEEDALPELRRLISISKLVTPNIHEAEILSGIRIESEEDMEIAAERIGNCVITGGELNATDILYYKESYRFGSKWKEVNIHGSGCAFSAAITANLANNLDLINSVKCAKEFIEDSINRNFAVGSGLRVLDTGRIKLGTTQDEKEKKSVIENVEKAVRNFILNENSYKLVPETGINIAMALPNAKGIEDVAAITGRLIFNRKRIIPVGEIDFSGSSHLARVVLTAMRYNPEKRAAMNIKFSDEILKICENLDLKIAGFEREKQPKNTRTMEWGTKEAIKKLNLVPDIIYDRGGKGKEAMIRILGSDAIDVTEIATKISNLL